MCILLVVACIFTGGIWRKKRRNGHKVDASCGFKSLSVNTFTPPLTIKAEILSVEYLKFPVCILPLKSADLFQRYAQGVDSDFYQYKKISQKMHKFRSFQLSFFIAFLTMSAAIITRQIAFDAISGVLCVINPLIIQQRLPMLTRYFTRSAFFASIPALRKAVAIQPIMFAISSIFSPFRYECNPARDNDYIVNIAIIFKCH